MTKKRKYIISGILLAFIIAIGGVIFYSSSSSSKMSELGTLNIEYQEKWRVLDTNITSYDTLVGLLAEEYQKGTGDKALTNEWNSIHVEYSSATDKEKKYELFKKFKTLENKLRTNLASSKIDTEMTKVAYEQIDKIMPSINAQIKEYNVLVKKYNKILESPTLKFTNKDKFKKQLELK